LFLTESKKVRSKKIYHDLTNPHELRPQDLTPVSTPTPPAPVHGKRLRGHDARATTLARASGVGAGGKTKDEGIWGVFTKRKSIMIEAKRIEPENTNPMP
jgi:hypothetical protein